MDRYQKVEKPKPESPINENEIRITTQGAIRNYITYATSLLQVLHRFRNRLLSKMRNALGFCVFLGFVCSGIFRVFVFVDSVLFVWWMLVLVGFDWQCLVCDWLRLFWVVFWLWKWIMEMRFMVFRLLIEYWVCVHSFWIEVVTYLSVLMGVFCFVWLYGVCVLFDVLVYYDYNRDDGYCTLEF